MVLTKTRPVAAPPRKIRSPEFAKRLESACDGNGLCPPMHKGRLTWVQRELSSRFKEDVSVETVRKWFAGEAQPRRDKTVMLAELLQVDVTWLEMGIDLDLAPRERKIRNATADGVVNLVAGLIQMDGGHPAFPDSAGPVDLHAIIRGAKYDLRIAAANEAGVFHVPVDYEGCIVLGVVKHGFSVEIYEIGDEMIERNGNRRGGSIEVAVSTKKLKRVESFRDRL